MENHDFWNICSNGSIREDVAKFIDSTSAVAKLKDAAYYEFEDALVNFLQSIKEKIYRECDRLKSLMISLKIGTRGSKTMILTGNRFGAHYPTPSTTIFVFLTMNLALTMHGYMLHILMNGSLPIPTTTCNPLLFPSSLETKWQTTKRIPIIPPWLWNIKRNLNKTFLLF